MLELVVRGASQVVTHGSASAEATAIGFREGRVAWVGKDAPSAETIIEAKGGFVGPGFVDPHTHLVFAGDRSNEFELRCRGATYQEIAQAGGGIASTVRATRAASEDELVALALPRLARLLEQGVTTAEVKSGYGLDVETELKMLRVIQRLSRLQPIELVPTLLCAHAVPKELGREAYVQLCIQEIIPKAAPLARFCDAFVEKGAFTVEEARAILTAAKAHGLIPRVHADQLSASGGSVLAAELGAASADHLEFIDDAGIAALARAGTSAVLVPATTLFLRQRPYAPGRRLLDAGVNVALGTNVNPGSAMSENLGLTLGLGCLENGLTPREAYWGMTRGAAQALRLERAGRLTVGDPGDCVVFSCADPAHLPYHLGVNHTTIVIKAGRVVHEADRPICA